MSKKLCMCIVGINAIIQMSQGSENKIWYAAIIAGIVVVYKFTQAYLDKNK